jgi:hypothetical protein
MKRVIISVSILLLLGLIGYGSWYVLTLTSTPQNADTGAPVSLPIDQHSLNSATAINISGLNGTPITTANFIVAKNTVKDTQNEGQYYIVQSSTSCYPDCTEKNIDVPYDILFNTADNSFTISILAEPLGSARIAAEQYLMKTLNISQEDMCKLNYFISTSSHVNATYGGTNLGFSFCPGAVKLP